MAEKKKKKKVPFVEAKATPMTSKEIGVAKRSGRLDLAKSEAKRKGLPEPTMEGGRIVSGKETKKKEIKEIAEKSFGIAQEKKRLETEERDKTREEQPEVVEENIDPVTGEPLLSGGVSSAEGLVTDVALLATGGTAAKFIAQKAGKKAVDLAAGKVLRKNVFAKFKNAFPTTTDDIAKYGKDILKTTKTGKGKLLYGLGAMYAINEFVLSPSELATWAAVDNIAGVAGFLTRDVVNAVKFDNMPREEAEEAISNAEQSVAKSKNFVNLTTLLNPKLWANRKMLMGAVEEAEKRVLFSRQQLDLLSQ